MRKSNEKLSVGEMLGNSLYAIKSLIVGDSNLEEDRKNALRYGDNDDDLIIDTCHCIDTGFYETGIIDIRYDSGKDWVIVEEYNTKEKAKIGHDKWVKKMKSKKIPKFIKAVSTGEKYNLNENKTKSM